MSERQPVDHLAAWRARTAGDEPGEVVAPLRPSSKYGEAVLAGELERVRGAVEGERNSTLNVAALKCGRAVAGGHLDGDVVRSSLMSAAVDIGLTRTEARNTIRSGMRAGERHPRVPEERPEQAAPDVREVPGVPGTRQVSVTVTEPPPVAQLAEGYLRPASWLLDQPDDPPPLWGEPDAPLWATGQALMIAASPGVGKTTLAVQLVRARLGLDSHVLELPVAEGKRVLYLCMDRPQQIAGAIRRALERAELEAIGDRLVLGWGPPPADVVRHPELLAELAASAQADTIVVDSLKDAALKLTDDEVGATYNRARQLALAAGVEVLELHHLVKRNAEGKAPTALPDVYGSGWLTAGAGSVLLMHGEAGDPIVKASHLKPVRDPWGPQWLAHDHTRGRTTVHNRIDLLELLAVTRVQTALSAAQRLYETEKPSRAQAERARRQLDRLVRDGLAWSEPGRPGAEGGAAATRYHPMQHPEPTTLGDDDDA